MNQTLFRDTLLNMLLMLVVIVVLILPHLNPPAAEEQSDPPGNLIVHITWPSGNVDIDLWTHGPGELVPIGYSNRTGRLWNLLRDDLGTGTDATDLNYENSFSRGIVPGVYWINVHCYRCPVLPIPVDVEVSLNKDAGQKGVKTASKILVTTQVVLNKNQQELTAISFELTADGNVVPDTMNSVFKPLRAMAAK